MSTVTRRQTLSWMAALGGAYGLGLATPKLIAFVEGAPLRRAVNAVLKSKPVSTGLDLGKPVARLVKAGAIDPGKFLKAHKIRGPVPEWVSHVLDGKSQELILSAENAAFNLNLLWPIGLATKAVFNNESPLNGSDLPNFASTGGWSLGRKNNGAAYFNKVETVSLSLEQSSLARKIAGNVYRPCCGNSAFFQDCNHGSAMLGLIELAASNGRNSASIMTLGKVANGFWYPEQYVEIAMFFDTVKDVSWENAPPDLILSSEFSSVGGWNNNVHVALADQGLLLQPQQRGGGGSGCAV